MPSVEDLPAWHQNLPLKDDFSHHALILMAQLLREGGKNGVDQQRRILENHRAYLEARMADLQNARALLTDRIEQFSRRNETKADQSLPHWAARRELVLPQFIALAVEGQGPTRGTKQIQRSGAVCARTNAESICFKVCFANEKVRGVRDWLPQGAIRIDSNATYRRRSFWYPVPYPQSSRKSSNELAPQPISISMHMDRTSFAP